MKTGFEIIQGSALDILKQMPDEIVQCCITSPPYYGLRSYGTEPLIWGGDENCRHVWGGSIPYAKQDNRTKEEKIAQGASVGSSIMLNSTTTTTTTTATSGSFCQSCNAWLGELGLEPTLHLYVDHLIQIFTEVRRVLRPDGSCWVNIGDSYSGSNGAGYPMSKWNGLYNGESLRRKAGRIDTVPAKSLMNIPGRFAIAMTDELGFVQRNQCNWFKPAAMPSSAKDRFTVDFEPFFFFTKNPIYKFNQQFEPYSSKPQKQRDKNAEKYNGTGLYSAGARDYYSKGGRNYRTTWSINYEKSAQDDFYAAYPSKLLTIPILSCTDEGDTILDPFNGTGTTGDAALRFGRKYIGIEMLEKNATASRKRLEKYSRMLF